MEKTSRCRVKNHQTQTKYDPKSGNRTRATLVWGECSPFSIPATRSQKKSFNSKPFLRISKIALWPSLLCIENIRTWFVAGHNKQLWLVQRIFHHCQTWDRASLVEVETSTSKADLKLNLIQNTGESQVGFRHQSDSISRKIPGRWPEYYRS